MIVVVINLSKRKAFRRTKRIINTVLPRVDLRVNIGDIPKRVLIKLIENVKQSVTKGVSVKFFIESKNGFRGFKCVEIGTAHYYLENFVNAVSAIDKDLLLHKIIKDIKL